MRKGLSLGQGNNVPLEISRSGGKASLPVYQNRRLKIQREGKRSQDSTGCLLLLTVAAKTKFRDAA